MKKIHAFGLLAMGFVLLSACTQQSDLGKPLTVGQYLHNIDFARSILRKANNDKAKYQNDPAYINANSAVAASMTAGDAMLACWPKKPVSTATTDHDCLDRLGYAR